MSKAQVTRSETVAVQPTDTEQSANRCPGLVWAFHFSADGTSQELSEFTLPPHVVDRRGDDGWLWVHVNLSDARAATYLRAHLDDLPKAAVNLLLSIGEHQQLHAEDACVYGVFADLVYLLEGLTDELGLLHFVATEKRLITGRRDGLHSTEAVRKTLRSGQSPKNHMALLESIFMQVISGVEEKSVALSDELDLVEERLIVDLGDDIPDGLRSAGALPCGSTGYWRRSGPRSAASNRIRGRPRARPTTSRRARSRSVSTGWITRWLLCGTALTYCRKRFPCG